MQAIFRHGAGRGNLFREAEYPYTPGSLDWIRKDSQERMWRKRVRMKVLEMKGIRKCFSGKEILRGVDLSCEEGEVFSIIGPSGSGKSTLLRIACFLEKADAGSMSYFGKRVFLAGLGAGDKEQEEAGRAELAQNMQKAKESLSLVFQNFNLFPHWTVLENIVNPMIHVQKKDRMIAREKGRELLGRMGLADKEKEYPFALSGGQKQRVAIARALALEPKILFFDEPTSALDPKLTGEILALIRSLKDSSMAMVIVTHEMQFAREISDRILFLSEGEVLCVGSPEEVFSSGNERLKNFLGGYTRERI